MPSATQPATQVETCVLEDTLTCRGEPVLTYRLTYPQVRSAVFAPAAARISAYYRLEALRLQIEACGALYREAVRQYHEAREQGYPVMVYEVRADFTVTLQQSCTLSLYMDIYRYTGGAHGMTTRVSQTWDLRTGEKIPLCHLISGFRDMQAYFTGEVVRQLRAQLEAGEGSYFDSYAADAVQEFDPAQYYLTPEGVVIYYQLYAVAPYSSGIPVFLVPYSRQVRPPRCR